MLSSEFNWDKYLKTCEAKAAPENLFKPVSLSFKANVAVSFNVSQMLKSLLRNDDAEPEWNRFPHPPTHPFPGPEFPFLLLVLAGIYLSSWMK